MSANDAQWRAAIRDRDRQSARRLYEQFGEELRREMEEDGGSPLLSLPHTNRLLTQLISCLDGKRALDIGCGPSPVAAMSLRQAGFETFGIDVAQSILRIARSVAGEGIHLTCADAEQLPFPESAFDVITCDDTLEHAFDQQALVREAARVLRPGGRMLVVTPNAPGFHVWLARGLDLLRGRRRPREAYHITQQHTRELRWGELRSLFAPWFTMRQALAVGPASGSSMFPRLVRRALRLPRMARFGLVHVIELERRPLGRALVGDAAKHYAQVAGAESQTSPGVIRHALKRWLRRPDVEGPILDLGCGVGTNLELMAGRFRAVGSDISASAARAAVSIAPSVAADGARLPFAGETFGAVVCTEVLEHTDDPGAVFSEMARVLRPGGLAYVTTPNYANLAGLHKLLADRRSGRNDWNPWGAHEGGYEAFMTGRRLRRHARPYLEVVEARGRDFGQALTGRFRVTDRLAWSRSGRAVLRRVLPRLEGSGGLLAWHAMHTELVLRRTTREGVSSYGKAKMTSVNLKRSVGRLLGRKPRTQPVLRSIKTALLDRAFSQGDWKTFADLGGVWAVEGGYSFYLLDRYQVERACLVDTGITEGVRARARAYPQLELIEANFGATETPERVGRVGAVIMFDVLLHQVAPDWDDILRMYAPWTEAFLIANPQYTGASSTTRLVDLGREAYMAAVPAIEIHEEAFDRFEETHPKYGRRYRDIHEIWQWGIVDEDLDAVMTDLGFVCQHRVDAGAWHGLEQFRDRVFMYVKRR